MKVEHVLQAAMRHVDPQAATARVLDDLAAAPRAAAEDIAASKSVQEAAQADGPAAATPLPGALDVVTQRLIAEADDMLLQREALPLSPQEKSATKALRDSAPLAEGDARAFEQAALCLVGVR